MSAMTAILSNVHQLGGHFEVGVCLHGPGQLQHLPGPAPPAWRCLNCGWSWAANASTFEPIPILRYTG